MYAYFFVEAIQNQNHHKKDEVNATTSFDNFNLMMIIGMRIIMVMMMMMR